MVINQAWSGKSLIRVDVVEQGGQAKQGWLPCEIDNNVVFATEHLESYCFANWNPLIYDALLVAAVVEFADRTLRRPALAWHRHIEIRIPVHSPEHWNSQSVVDELRSTLNFLTGDSWLIQFYGRRSSLIPPRQGRFVLPEGLSAVIPFSDGLDSRSVAGLMARRLNNQLMRVRLGLKGSDAKELSANGQPFTFLPYKVRPGEKRFVEATVRSRGFKFALISGLASFLAKAGQVIIPESGQGALGPALVTVGHGYEDYRSHPLFTSRMERFLTGLLDYKVRYLFPRLWQTKAETLREFVEECPDGKNWFLTWSCWQQTRQVSVDGKKRQCGICAACLLRRMSVHAAGLVEPQSTYVWENLSSAKFQDGTASSFAKKKITYSLKRYAIAGSLHLDHLAGVRHSVSSKQAISLTAHQLGRELGLTETATRTKLDCLLARHEQEWKNFVQHLGPTSFVANWATQANYDRS